MINVVEQGKVPILMWTDKLPVEARAMEQIRNVASLPIISPHVAIMPDVHWGIGATVGSVIATKGAIIPAAVGVDIGCGMMALKTSLSPDNIQPTALLSEIEAAVPHGGPGVPGSWSEAGRTQPDINAMHWAQLYPGWMRLLDRHPKIKGVAPEQLGTLGGGNHFIEICTELNVPQPTVWIMLHSGSRGPGNRIGQYFIGRAREQWVAKYGDAPGISDLNLAWLTEHTKAFTDYIDAVSWAQDYALINRNLMMGTVVHTLRKHVGLDRGWPTFRFDDTVISCHHNYVARETHFGESLYITRKGAVSAKMGELGIIPGSMGAKSFIVKGKGNPYSFMSCSHGAGRAKSRSAAKRDITPEQHQAAMSDVACRTTNTIDESPSAYKDIDAVMAAQTDLVEIVTTLKQIVCVKG